MLAFNKAHTFNDGCKITQTSSTTVEVAVQGKTFSFNEEGKPNFKNNKGESVIEYSGLATDKVSECSWAIAKFDPTGASSNHFHSERTEDYYILSGNAKVVLDDQAHFLNAGDHLEIKPGQKHQVFNLSPTEKLELIVKCTPAWVFHDCHFVTQESMDHIHEPSKSYTPTFAGATNTPVASATIDKSSLQSKLGM